MMGFVYVYVFWYLGGFLAGIGFWGNFDRAGSFLYTLCFETITNLAMERFVACHVSDVKRNVINLCSLGFLVCQIRCSWCKVFVWFYNFTQLAWLEMIKVSVWIPRLVTSTFSAFFFFFRAWTVTSHGFTVHALFGTVHALFSTVHVLKNVKNGSHDTIYTIKNYFATVISVFSNNKLNPNGPKVISKTSLSHTHIFVSSHTHTHIYIYIWNNVIIKIWF